jgi:hypothetical protein
MAGRLRIVFAWVGIILGLLVAISYVASVSYGMPDFAILVMVK